MKKIKLIAEQSLLIAVLILIVMGIEGFISYLEGDPVCFDWYQPFAVLLVSILCSLPTLLLLRADSYVKARRVVINILHCLLLYAVTMGAGYLFNWYSSIRDILVTTIAYLVIYCMVWIITTLVLKYEERQINDALRSIQDEE